MTLKEWLGMTVPKRRKQGYLENYPIKSSKVQWSTVRSGIRVGRMFLSDAQMAIAVKDAKKRNGGLDIIDPSTGETIIGPEWYIEGVMGEKPSKTLCPICHRALKNGYCMEHGDVRAQGYRWDDKKKKWIKPKQPKGKKRSKKR